MLQERDNAIERTQFTFYKSYYEGIIKSNDLSDENKLLLLTAMCEFSYYGKIPKNVEKLSQWALISPTLRTGRNRAINATKSKGKTRNKGNANAVKQNKNKTKTKQKQNEKEKEREKENEKENENDSSLVSISLVNNSKSKLSLSLIGERERESVFSICESYNATDIFDDVIVRYERQANTHTGVKDCEAFTKKLIMQIRKEKERHTENAQSQQETPICKPFKKTDEKEALNNFRALLEKEAKKGKKEAIIKLKQLDDENREKEKA